MNRNSQGPSCSHGYSVHAGKHPNGKVCNPEWDERRDEALKRIVVEDEKLLEKLRSCRNTPCLICNHTGCGWCPDCSPQVPEWD